jgi:hypothetical protein
MRCAVDVDPYFGTGLGSEAIDVHVCGIVDRTADDKAQT